MPNANSPSLSHALLWGMLGLVLGLLGGALIGLIAAIALDAATAADHRDGASGMGLVFAFMPIGALLGGGLLGLRMGRRAWKRGAPD